MAARCGAWALRAFHGDKRRARGIGRSQEPSDGVMEDGGSDRLDRGDARRGSRRERDSRRSGRRRRVASVALPAAAEGAAGRGTPTAGRGPDGGPRRYGRATCRRLGDEPPADGSAPRTWLRHAEPVAEPVRLAGPAAPARAGDLPTEPKSSTGRTWAPPKLSDAPVPPAPAAKKQAADIGGKNSAAAPAMNRRPNAENTTPFPTSEAFFGPPPAELQSPPALTGFDEWEISSFYGMVRSEILSRSATRRRTLVRDQDSGAGLAGSFDVPAVYGQLVRFRLSLRYGLGSGSGDDLDHRRDRRVRRRRQAVRPVRDERRRGRARQP